MEKINETEVREVVTQPNIEVVHSLDDLLEKKQKIKDEIAVLKLVIDDLQVMIDSARALGVKTRAEVKVIIEPLSEEVVIEE